MYDLLHDKEQHSVELDAVTEDFMFWAHALESEIQIILDTSLPNKQQHRAASRLLHDLFVKNTVEFKMKLSEAAYPLHMAVRS